MQPQATPNDSATPGGLSRRGQYLALLAITIIAACLRLYRLGDLPPGDGFDVAQYGVDALQILQGARPIFLESNFGREVLFSYLVALTYLVTGPGAFGIHLVSALIGIATIPAIFLAARELFHAERDGALACLPILAAFLAAVSYWHLNWSRVGLRVILVPLFAALLVWSLWRGFRTDRARWFALGGVLLGLSLYTYQAARLLPPLVAVAFALHGLWRRRWTRADTAHLLVTAALALLVALPLLNYAREHPGALSVRIRQATVVDTTLPPAEQAVALVSQATTALLTYSFRGDSDPQFTIPGRPSLNPFLSVGLALGILAALLRFRRAPYLFLPAWLAIMTAPAMVADLAATAKRYLGAFPAVMILIAFGFLVVLDWLRRRDGTTRRYAATLYVVALGLGLLYTAVRTYRDYFIVWAADPDLPAHFQIDYRLIGEAVGRLAPGRPVWLSPYPPDHPVIQLHAGLRPDLRGYNGRFCVPYTDPAGAQGVTYVIVPGLQDSSLDKLQLLFPDGRTSDGPLRPGSDRPYYRLFEIPPGATTGGPTSTPQATWDGRITLLDARVEPEAPAPGDAVTVTLTYKALADIAVDYTAFVHLLGPPVPDTGSPLRAQADNAPCGGGLPTYRWREEDVIRDTVTVQLPADLPAGEYQLVTGFYTWPDLARLPVDETGADAVEIGPLNVRSP